MLGEKYGNGFECTGSLCCQECADDHCCASIKGATARRQLVHTCEIDTQKCGIHGRWECKRCGKAMTKINDSHPNGMVRPGISLPYLGPEGLIEYDSMGFSMTGHIRGTNNSTCRGCRIEMGFPVGETIAERAKKKVVKAMKTKAAQAKRPPEEIHIKDVETALHNLFCQDVGDNRINREAGLDLFDNHRKAANTLVEQLKLQGIKLVPDPDFEDKAPICKHPVMTGIKNDDGVRIGQRCLSECGKDFLFR